MIKEFPNESDKIKSSKFCKMPEIAVLLLLKMNTDFSNVCQSRKK
jgi:hypothetical protein